MEDIICVSSGSDEDSDLEVISSYKEDKEDAVPFIRAEWLPVTPVLIDITDHNFTPPRRRSSRRKPCTAINIIDLSEEDAPDDIDVVQTDKTAPSFGKPLQSQKDYVRSFVPSIGEDNTDVLRSAQDTNYNSIPSSEHLSWDKTLDHFSSDSIRDPCKSESEVFRNSTADASQNTKDAENQWEKDDDRSPYSLDSQNYCPSEVDDYLFSDSSNKSEYNHHHFKTHNSQESPQNAELSSENVSICNALLLKEDKETMDVTENCQVHPKCSLNTSFFPCWSPEQTPRQSKPNSPTSTEILASDTAALSPDFSTPSSPNSSFSLLNSQPGSPENSPVRVWETRSDCEDNAVSDYDGKSAQETQRICLAQYRKLSRCFGGTVLQTHEDEDEDEHYGPAEPLCRQSLSLVYSTIEENYPEGTLQLLSDFIQPRYYPPLDITTHLLRGVFLDPQTTDVLTVEAFNLLMKTQRYHPVDASTVPWDWELIKSVMKDQDDTWRLRTEVQVMLLQYVLQGLEDDFHLKLSTQCLQHSLAKKVLSCGPETFGQVRDVISWTMTAAKESVKHSKEHPKKEDHYLKMVLSLQRMLSLALEVDKDPTYNSDKLSEALIRSLNRLCSCREMRLLLLNTLESKLLKCKLLNLLLDETCLQKTALPMSLSLILHYLKSSTLASDPSDGAEKWRKWDELLQLLWMLLLSYDEVMTGHLRCSITRRFERIQAPSWTGDDQVMHSAVKAAADAFISRAEFDTGHSLPTEIRDLLSQLQEHITDTSSVISSH